MGDARFEFVPLGIVERRRGGVVQHAVQQAMRQFQAFTRRELLQLFQEGALFHGDRVRFAGRVSIPASPVYSGRPAFTRCSPNSRRLSPSLKAWPTAKLRALNLGLSRSRSWPTWRASSIRPLAARLATRKRMLPTKRGLSAIDRRPHRTASS